MSLFMPPKSKNLDIMSSNSLKYLQIGCHHCRGAHPLPADLQKELIELRSGTIVSLLDKDYEAMVIEIAERLPEDRQQGLAVVWKNKSIQLKDLGKPKNLFIHGDTDRQNLIGMWLHIACFLTEKGVNY